MNQLNILVAGEYSGTVRDAFLQRGHNAMSCDLLPSEAPGPHYQGDVRDVLRDGWDIMVGHPPCTFLANSGSCRLYHTDKTKNKERWESMAEAAAFFLELWNAPINKICLENPIQHGHAKKLIGFGPSQYIQPYQFGHYESKKTGLYLKNLPLLTPTNILKKPACGHWSNQTASGQNKIPPSPDRWKLRAKTYKGIAQAMAYQWAPISKQSTLYDFNFNGVAVNGV